MADYDNTNTGTLFVNDKAGNDKRPDFKGSLNVNGVEYWISSWLKSPRAGGPQFQSVKIEQKEKQAPKQGIAQSINPPARPTSFMADDDINF